MLNNTKYAHNVYKISQIHPSHGIINQVTDSTHVLRMRPWGYEKTFVVDCQMLGPAIGAISSSTQKDKNEKEAEQS